MANIKLSKTFLAITAFSATSEATGYPKEDAVNRTSPMLQWRTTVTTDSRLVIDLGAVQTDITVLLDYLNSTFKFQESADGSTGWVDLTSVITPSIDPIHGVYRHKQALTLTSKRYLGIFIPSQTPLDGAAYFRIGTVAVPTSITEININTRFGYPFSYELSDGHIVVNEYPTGKADKVSISPLPALFIIMDLATDVDRPNFEGSALTELMNIVRDATAIIYIDFNLGRTWQAYLVTREGQAIGTIDRPELLTVKFGVFRLRVLV